MADDHLHPHGNKPLQHHSDLGPGPRIDATAHREHFRLHEDPALLSSSVAPFESAAPAQNEQRFRRWCRGCSAAEAATTKRLRLWPLVAAIRRTQPRRRLAWRLLVRAESPAHRRNHGARGVQNRDLPMQSQPVSTALRLRLDARLRHAQRSRCCRCGRTTRRGAGDCMRGKGNSEAGAAARAEAVVAPTGAQHACRCAITTGAEFAGSRFRASTVTFVRRQRPYRRSPRSRSPGCCSARAERSSHRCRDKRCSVCRIAPGALLRPGPPRNRTGTFQRIRLEQAVEIRWRNAIRSARKTGACRPQVRSPRRWPRRLTCPLVPASSSSSSRWLT